MSDTAETTTTAAPVRYKKPKIVTVDLPVSLAERLRNAGYNVRPGTFGRPYRVQRGDGFVPIVVGSIQLSWQWVAGLIMIVMLASWRWVDWNRMREGIGSALLAGAFGFAIIYVCLVAMSPALHNLSLTPERVMVLAMGTALLFPFWMGFEFILRRGGLAFSNYWAHSSAAPRRPLRRPVNSLIKAC